MRFYNYKHLYTLISAIIVFIITSSFFNFLTYTKNSETLKYVNWTGLALFLTGIIIGFLLIFLSDTRVFFLKKKSLIIMFFFYTAIWLFINETHLLNMFFYYELFLLPSFYLVYYLSPNRRSSIASIYFLTWTQLGSLFVLCAVIILFFKNNNISIEFLNFNYDRLVFWFIFIGFGIKIPMWPFYYWLTKTHVEASSFFSMYLSGFLVKTAVYLFIKFYAILQTGFDINLFLIFFIIGIIDSSIKMWHQTDLKKLIAYTTVQEMNLLCIPILWNDLLGEQIVALFIVTHCLLSCLFFFFIDIINKRYNTRSSTQICGIQHNMPNFAFYIFISWILFSGLPFTIKFLLEIGILSGMLHFNVIITIITLFIMNVIGLIGFSKNIFNALFGAPILQYKVLDLTKREQYLIVLMCLGLLFLNTVTICF